jgi:hypothetical protein
MNKIKSPVILGVMDKITLFRNSLWSLYLVDTVIAFPYTSYDRLVVASRHAGEGLRDSLMVLDINFREFFI